MEKMKHVSAFNKANKASDETKLDFYKRRQITTFNQLDSNAKTRVELYLSNHQHALQDLDAVVKFVNNPS